MSSAPALTIWLTGLAAAGKTTLGTRLSQDLAAAGYTNVDFLDGEVLRDRLAHFGYSTADRNTLGLQKAGLALDLNRAGRLVIVTGIAHHRETRARIRRLIGGYIEVYLKCDAETCARRDYKGHYQKAFAGELEHFVGVTEPYEESAEVELVLDTARHSSEECARQLFEYVTRRFAEHPARTR